MKGAAVRSRPVTRLLQLAALPHGRGSGHQFANAAEQRFRSRNVAISQIVPDGVQIHGSLNARDAQQRLDLGGKVQRASVLTEKQRLLAEAVPRQEKAFISGIPDRECKHAAQVMDDLALPVLIGAQQHFGVGIAHEPVPELAQLAAQFTEIVDLAVEGQRKPGGGIAHRLVRPFRVDDRQPPVPQKHTVFGTCTTEIADALIVRSAMGDRLQHRRERALRQRALPFSNPSRDSAHVETSGLQSGRRIARPRYRGHFANWVPAERSFE